MNKENPLFDYDFEKIHEYADSLKDKIEYYEIVFKKTNIDNHVRKIESNRDKIAFLSLVLREYHNNDVYKFDLTLKKGMPPTTLERELKADIEHLERLDNTQTGKSSEKLIPPIHSKVSMSDIVRIFEAMREAEIISFKTEVKQIAQMFFKYPGFEGSYNSTKSRIEKNESQSNSKELEKFIKILCEKSFKKKGKVLDSIIEYLEKLQSDWA